MNKERPFLELLVGIAMLFFGGIATQYIWNNGMAVIFDAKILSFAEALTLDVVVTYLVAPSVKDTKNFGEFLLYGAQIFTKTLFFMLLIFILSHFI